jgi:hypothetical protein
MLLLSEGCYATPLICLALAVFPLTLVREPPIAAITPKLDFHDKDFVRNHHLTVAFRSTPTPL